MTLYTAICAHCGGTFTTTDLVTTYCSELCAMKAKR